MESGPRAEATLLLPGLLLHFLGSPSLPGVSFSHSAAAATKSLQSCPTLMTSQTATPQASGSFTISGSLFKLMSSLQCHATISSSAVPFYSCLQSLPASESFSRSWLFASGGQSFGTSSTASVLPMNIQG